jgi:hypothetical protein
MRRSIKKHKEDIDVNMNVLAPESRKYNIVFMAYNYLD